MDKCFVFRTWWASILAWTNNRTIHRLHGLQRICVICGWFLLDYAVSSPSPSKKTEVAPGLLPEGRSDMDVPQFIAGRFRIEREIGTGGMGTVYLATHLELERPVAVKIIKRECASDVDVNDRFLREARTMAKLRH